MKEEAEDYGFIDQIFDGDQFTINVKLEPFGSVDSPACKTKKRKSKLYTKWNDFDKKIYWFSFLTIAQENPFVKLSWDNWKIDRCFKKMETFFKGRKTNYQIKSFDQRMKKQFQKQRNIDLMQAICRALKQLPLTGEQIIKLKAFEQSQRNSSTKIEQFSKIINEDVVAACRIDLLYVEELYKNMYN